LKIQKRLTINNVLVENRRRMEPTEIIMYDMRGAAETRGYPVSLASYLRLMAGASVLLVAAALASAALGQTADLSVTAEIQATCTWTADR
jgi:hypothetical protein